MFCKMEKAWLSRVGVDYTEKDVVEDEEALAELQDLGVFTTPVTVIDGEVVIGFDRNRLEKLLDLSSEG